MMDGYGAHGWGFGWSWIIVIGIVVIIVWGVIKGVQGMNKRRKNYIIGKSSLDILKDRYARGLIDKQEFEERKKGLTSRRV